MTPRLDMLDLDAVDVSAEQAEELFWAALFIEALGSIDTVAKLGLLDGMGDQLIQILWERAPGSRGGGNHTAAGECNWERMVNEMLAEYGSDLFDVVQGRMLAALEEDTPEAPESDATAAA